MEALIGYVIDRDNCLKSAYELVLDVLNLLYLVIAIGAEVLFADEKLECVPFVNGTMKDFPTTHDNYISSHTECGKEIPSKIKYSWIVFVVPIIHIIMKKFRYILSSDKKEMTDLFKKCKYKKAESLWKIFNHPDNLPADVKDIGETSKVPNNIATPQHTEDKDDRILCELAIRDQKYWYSSLFVYDLVYTIFIILITAVALIWLVGFIRFFSNFSYFECHGHGVKFKWENTSVRCSLSKFPGPVWYSILCLYFSIYVVVSLFGFIWVEGRAWRDACKKVQLDFPGRRALQYLINLRNGKHDSVDEDHNTEDNAGEVDKKVDEGPECDPQNLKDEYVPLSTTIEKGETDNDEKNLPKTFENIKVTV